MPVKLNRSVTDMATTSVKKPASWSLLEAFIRFRKGERGVAAVEFAFIAPIMILLFVGTLELSSGISVNRKLSRLSSTLSDLVTQSQSLDAAAVQDIMKAAAKVIHPYDEAKVKIVLTGINIDAANAAKVEWSCAMNTTANAPGSLYNTVPSLIKVSNTFLVSAKVTTNYEPTFGWAQFSGPNGLSFSRDAINMEEEIFLRPRMSAKTTVTC
jgi:Flp pilus assembly protein TadG